MTNGRKIALAVIGAAGVAAGYLAYQGFLASSLEMTCERQLLDQKISPDGRLKAAIVNADCGATTGFEARVLITQAGKSFDDVHDEAARFHGLARRLEWDGATLKVFEGDAEPTKAPNSFRGTPIAYVRAE